MLGVDIASDFSVSQNVQWLVTTSVQTIYVLHVLRSRGLSNANVQMCTRPPSSHGWHMLPARNAVSPRCLIASTSTRWSIVPAATDTARRICHHLTNCVTLRTKAVRLSNHVLHALLPPHPLHHNVTICENAHIHSTYLSILLTSQTVILLHTWCIKALTRPRHNSNSYIAIYRLCFCTAILALYHWTGNNIYSAILYFILYFVNCLGLRSGMPLINEYWYIG